MNAEQITVAASGKISVAPVGSTLPEDPTTELDAAFIELGYVTEEGVTFSAEPTVEDINAWQKSDPVRRIVTARALTVSFQGLEWHKDSFALAFGGGTWSEEAEGVYRYDPPASNAPLAEYALVIDAADDDRNNRWVVKRGSVTDAVETNLIRTGAALLPVTFSALSPDDEDTAWYFVSDDEAFALS